MCQAMYLYATTVVCIFFVGPPSHQGSTYRLEVEPLSLDADDTRTLSSPFITRACVLVNRQSASTVEAGPGRGSLPLPPPFQRLIRLRRANPMKVL